MSKWNFGDVWEAVADTLPDAPALTHGARTLTWGELDHRADNVARWLLGAGVGYQDKVALYLYNCPEYLEATFACFKLGLVPINTNYRYADDELVYLWENADAVAVVFHGSFADRIEGIRDRCPPDPGLAVGRRRDGHCPPWAESLRGGRRHHRRRRRPGRSGRVRRPWGRGPDDLYMLYTGGTTGMPKGVMWRQDDLFARLNAAGFRRYPDGRRTPTTSAPSSSASGPGMTLLPACPLMHGTGGFTSLECLSEGGRVVTLDLPPVRPGRAARHRRARAGQRAGHRGRRLRQAHPGRPGRPSRPMGPDQPGRDHLVGGHVERGDQAGPAPPPSGHAAGRRLLLVGGHRHGQLGLLGEPARRHTARFTLGPEVRVIDDDGQDVEPGSGGRGVLALGGRIPLGYYKDEAKTAATFRTIDGVRYSVPGDYAEVGEDGSIHLLGRGSVCINTGGEKVYPEEVEEVIKTSPAWPTPWWSASRTSASARRSWPWSRPPRRPGRLARPRPGHRPREVEAGRLQGAAPGPLRRHHRALAGGQGRLRPPPGRGGRVGRA